MQVLESVGIVNVPEVSGAAPNRWMVVVGVPTLATYLDLGGRYDDTARALFIHRNTLRYRLNRITEISGHDLADVDTKLNLHLAVRAWRLRHARVR